MYSTSKKTDLILTEALSNHSEAVSENLPDFNFVFFGKKDLETLLAAEECVGIRFRIGKSPNGYKTLIAIGVKIDGTEIQPATPRGLDGPPPGGPILSRQPCPDDCQ